MARDMADLRVVVGGRAGQGASGSWSRPAVSGRPWTTLNAWIGLAGRALDEVVEDADGEHAAGPLVHAAEDAELVAAQDVLRGGGVVDDRDERLVAVGLAVDLVELRLRDGAGRADVAGGEDPAGHRDEVGQEVDAAGARVRVRGGGLAGQLLLDLADVAVGEDAVRLDALVDLAEVEVGLGVAAGARDAALGVHDDVGDQAGTGERRQGEDRRRGVAAGGADDGARLRAQRGQLRAVQLRQAVDGGRRAGRAAGGRRGTRSRSPRRPGTGSPAPGR